MIEFFFTNFEELKTFFHVIGHQESVNFSKPKIDGDLDLSKNQIDLK